MKIYSYQYETSPRKLDSEYNYSRKNKSNTNKSKKKIQNNKKKAKNNKYTSKQKKNELKNEKEKQKKNNHIENVKTKIAIFSKCFLIFLVFFIIIYRNSIITQSFAQIQNLKATITELQKENNQLEINIQNSININTIEKAAKELLGMQKLSNKQIVYISLPKKDFVEPKIEEISTENDQGFIDRILEKIKNIF